ncbi:uncharacterized protein LOC135690747 [Rhopilema esculentum]|uniref:uncharacterized protein LOC135690747 n=1 Tax=Rhopilema esculentum TaxID=499914 RepID=UPI0031D7A75B
MDIGSSQNAMDTGSREYLIERDQLEEAPQDPEPPVLKKWRHLFYTEKPIKLFVCIFFGLLPFQMSRHHTKRHHMYLSAILLILQWFSISMYIYCIKTYWTSGGGPHIPRDTMVVMVALNTSTAVSFTLSVIYFYQSSNNLKAHSVFEWINVIKSTEEKHIENYNIWFAQLTGSCLISYKFAFPFISASRVTARFNIFYYNVARLTKVSDIPDLAVLREHSGFKLFGFRITTNVAMVAIFSSFIGALKFIADFSTNES